MLLTIAIYNIDRHALSGLHGTACKRGVMQDNVGLSITGEAVLNLLDAECGQLFGVNGDIQHIVEVQFCCFGLNVGGVKADQAILVFAQADRSQFGLCEQADIQQFL